MPRLGETASAPSAREERFLIRGVPWHVYVALRDSLDRAGSSVRLTYARGDLELMRSSRPHEDTRSILGRLVEAWCDVHDIDVFAQGSTTYRTEAAERGLEPDESYSVGARKPIPDLAIEVVYSSYKLDKLDVYRGLGVPEVWVWRDGAITIHRLAPTGYEIQTDSEVLAGIDVAHLASFVGRSESLTRIVREYRKSLAG
jgi:Uma2 family endonuclease